MKDYHIYSLSLVQKLCCLGAAAGIALLVSRLFYQSLWGLVSVPLFYGGIKKRVSRQFGKRRNMQMQRQFGDMLQMIETSLKSGCSVENAFSEGWKDFVRLYGEKGDVAIEFQNMNRQVQLNIPLERTLAELAERSDVEEIGEFVQIFQFARRGGGDFPKIFGDSVTKIKEKAEVLREIETVMAAKKLEQNIMNLVPVGILLYVSVSSPEFLQGLYGNLVGQTVMTGCLAVYAAAFQISRKIMDIQV